MAQTFAPGVVDYSDDPVLPPWYVPGWTSQVANQTSFAIPAPPSTVAAFSNLPTNIVYVSITGTFTDGLGSNLGGYLTFEQSSDLLIQDPNGTYFRVPSRLVGVIGQQNILASNAEGSGKCYIQFGQLSVQLMATDQPNATVAIQTPYSKTQVPGFVAPTTWVYHVKEYFRDGMMYDISVPSVLASSGTATDINTLIIANTYEQNPDWNRGF